MTRALILSALQLHIEVLNLQESLENGTEYDENLEKRLRYYQEEFGKLMVILPQEIADQIRNLSLEQCLEMRADLLHSESAKSCASESALVEVSESSAQRVRCNSNHYGPDPQNPEQKDPEHLAKNNNAMHHKVQSKDELARVNEKPPVHAPQSHGPLGDDTDPTGQHVEPPKNPAPGGKGGSGDNAPTNPNKPQPSREVICYGPPNPPEPMGNAKPKQPK